MEIWRAIYKPPELTRESHRLGKVVINTKLRIRLPQQLLFIARRIILQCIESNENKNKNWPKAELNLMPIYRKLNRNSPIYSSLCEVFQTWQIVQSDLRSTYIYTFNFYTWVRRLSRVSSVILQFQQLFMRSIVNVYWLIGWPNEKINCTPFIATDRFIEEVQNTRAC